ncbi:MAG: response regulator [Bacteroidota bacterium]
MLNNKSSNRLSRLGSLPQAGSGLFSGPGYRLSTEMLAAGCNPDFFSDSVAEKRKKPVLGMNTGTPDPAGKKNLMDEEDNNPSLKELPGRLKGRKFLLVEDNRMNQRLALNILERWEVEADLAENGAEALRMLAEKEYDLVLMDIHMPVLDGYEATVMIRNQMPAPVRHVPIIALTANAIKGFREECIKAGMNDFITKPYSQQALYAKCLRALKDEAALLRMSTENATPGARAYSEAVTDLSYLRNFSSNDTEFIREMVGIFIDRCTEDLPAIASAIAAGKYAEVRDLTHRIKPTIAFMGINIIKDQVQALEDMAGSEEAEPEVIKALFTEVEQVCTTAMQELRVYLASSGN